VPHPAAFALDNIRNGSAGFRQFDIRVILSCPPSNGAALLITPERDAMDVLKSHFPEDALDPMTEKLVVAFLERYRHASIGSLVGGIAHNFNGALQILSMRTELLQGVLLKAGDQVPETIHQSVVHCLDQIQKMKTMIETLIQKGIHDDEDGPVEIDVNELLEEQLALLMHNLVAKHQIRILKEFSPGLPRLHGYYIDFSQALSNIVENAVEAMEGAPVRELSLMTARQTPGIEIRIKDSGRGFSEEARSHLFTPFFTTKGDAHPGLGLFLSRRLLSPYGALVQCDSEAAGTTVRVRFPLKAPGQAR
jgi:signal transduction histidine kinase